MVWKQRKSERERENRIELETIFIYLERKKNKDKRIRSKWQWKWSSPKCHCHHHRCRCSRRRRCWKQKNPTETTHTQTHKLFIQFLWVWYIREKNPFHRFGWGEGRIVVCDRILSYIHTGVIDFSFSFFLLCFPQSNFSWYIQFDDIRGKKKMPLQIFEQFFFGFRKPCFYCCCCYLWKFW